MKRKRIFVLLPIAIGIVSCAARTYSTNCETIYMTGRNLRGEKIIGRPASRIPLVNSCRNCHGEKANGIKEVSVQFSYLSNIGYF